MPLFRPEIGGSMLALALIAAALAGPAVRAERQPPGIQAAVPPAADAYVGEQVCLGCHDEQAKAYHGSAHRRASTVTSPAATRGCESCHGPGKAHVDSNGDRGKIKTFSRRTPSADIDQQCLQCHGGSERALCEGSKHDGARISCVRCHSIHTPVTEGRLLRAREIEKCRECHRA